MGGPRHTVGGAVVLAVAGLVVCGALLGLLARQAITFVGHARSQALIAYSGKLLNNSLPVTDTCDFQFGLFDSQFGGRQLGKLEHRTITTVRGAFTTTLGFGRDARAVRSPYVELLVRCPSGSGEYVRMVRRPLAAAGAWFDMNSFADLADSLLGSKEGTENAEASSQGTEHPQSPPLGDESSGASEGKPIGPVTLKSAKAADDVAGHDGVKRAESQREDPPGALPPGEKRVAGTKAVKASSDVAKMARRRARLSAPIRVIETAPSDIGSPAAAKGNDEHYQTELGNDGTPQDVQQIVTESVPSLEDTTQVSAHAVQDPQDVQQTVTDSVASPEDMTQVLAQAIQDPQGAVADAQGSDDMQGVEALSNTQDTVQVLDNVPVGSDSQPDVGPS